MMSRLEVLEHHLDDPAPRASGGVDHPGAVGAHRGASGQRHPERLHRGVHGVRRRHALAHPGPADRVVGHPPEPVGVELAEGDLHAAEEDVLDVDVLAVDLAAGLVAADHEDRRHVEAPRRHEVGRRRLVAR
jgi:hypothetical protein